MNADAQMGILLHQRDNIVIHNPLTRAVLVKVYLGPAIVQQICLEPGSTQFNLPPGEYGIKIADYHGTPLDWNSVGGEPVGDAVETTPETTVETEEPARIVSLGDMFNDLRRKEATPLVGMPKIRDRDSPCGDFAPISQGYEDLIPKCETDGHYLCNDCCHRVKNEND